MGKITDPALLAQLETTQTNINRGDGKNGLSGAETRELSTARQATDQGRDAFPALANMYRVANRYPGGIPNNVADSWANIFGSKDAQVQDQQLFNSQATRAAIAKAKLLAPVSNNDLAMLKSAGPNPALRFGNNKELIGQEFSNDSRAYFENAFKQRWAARNGGLNGVDKGGHTYAEDLARAMRDKRVAPLLQPPWKRGQPKAAGAKVIDFNDLDD